MALKNPKIASKSSNDAHNIALEWLKQIITLSSGIIVLSATFISSIFKTQNWSIFFLVISWMSFVVAIISALETISVITQSRIGGDQEWSEGSGRNYAKVAKWFFIAGISLFIIFALINFFITIARKNTSPFSLYYL